MFDLFATLTGVIIGAFIGIAAEPLKQNLATKLHRKGTAASLSAELGFNRAKVQEWLRRLNNLKEHAATDSRELFSDNDWLDLSKISRDAYIRAAKNGELHYYFDHNARIDLKDFFGWCEPFSEMEQNYRLQRFPVEAALVYIIRWQSILTQWLNNLSRIETELTSRWKLAKCD